MRRLLTILVLALAATIFSRPALGGNQEVADQIAKHLKDSGRLSHFKIEVKYQKGTAWLKGYVQSQPQMNTALMLALQTAGVSRVVNDLAVRPPAAPTAKSAVRPPAAPAAELAVHPPMKPMPPAAEEAAIPAQTEAGQGSPAEPPNQMVASGQQQPAVPGMDRPASRQTPGRAQRVPSSFIPAPARQVAGAQPVVVPRTMIPWSGGRPIPIAYTQAAPEAEGAGMPEGQVPGGPIPAYVPAPTGAMAPARYDQPSLPNYAWPSYAAYPNYAALTYPRRYSPTAWPYIGPFYPYPQVPLGWRKVTLEWDDGWWMLDFKDTPSRRW
jgi:hypothetical protein